LSYVARQADATGIEPLPFVAWRGLVATIVLLIPGIVFSRAVGGTTRVPNPLLLPPDRRVALVVAALCGAILNVAMFAAFVLTTVAIALICFYTYPAIVTLAAVPLYGERLDRVRAGALVLSSVGLVLVVLAPLASSSEVLIDPLGVGLALLAALCQAAFFLISGRGWTPMPNLHVSTFVIAMAFAISVPLAVIGGQTAELLAPLQTPDSWIWILAGAITGAAIPTTAFITGIGLIGPSRAAILMTVEPLVGVTIAALLLGEQPSLIQIVGGAAVLVAAAVLQVASPGSKRAVPEPEVAPVL
jgi:drug/metabolite transporter (DMT)-like permease